MSNHYYNIIGFRVRMSSTSRLFFKKTVLEHLQPYISKSGATSSLQQFPIYFGNNKYKPADIQFYSSFLVPQFYSQAYISILQKCAHIEMQPGILAKTRGSASEQMIEPKLLQKLKQYKIQKERKLIIKKLEFKSSRVLGEKKIKGAFMHRQLNMPSECYSFEEKKDEEVLMRMRRKFTKEQHMKIFEKKQILYKKYQRYYLDSYKNFIQNEYIRRQVIQINAEIDGEILNKSNHEVIKLPLHSNKICTHLLQIENIVIPGSSQRETSLVTDIDYFMKGNPYTT